MGNQLTQPSRLAAAEAVADLGGSVTYKDSLGGVPPLAAAAAAAATPVPAVRVSLRQGHWRAHPPTSPGCLLHLQVGDASSKVLSACTMKAAWWWSRCGAAHFSRGCVAEVLHADELPTQPTCATTLLCPPSPACPGPPCRCMPSVWAQGATPRTCAPTRSACWRCGPAWQGWSTRMSGPCSASMNRTGLSSLCASTCTPTWRSVSPLAPSSPSSKRCACQSAQQQQQLVLPRVVCWTAVQYSPSQVSHRCLTAAIPRSPAAALDCIPAVAGAGAVPQAGRVPRRHQA